MKELSGSDSMGLKNFYNETNRFSARDFEDNLSLSFIQEKEIKKNLAFNHKKWILFRIK